ncbi:nucleotide pyrophosphohydrolase [Halorubrum coriense DSM 10284]|uniref:Nucleotide pyrophosphohydrolase n=1 Tax=Halorubrum coriense DSM 10284 TaxID=1227466 RepID=M0E8J8_9EURY|nr:MazG-like family protein [Halorubrum coriense]ELZ43348.1 nucleotide pyrophosphohydrolase [Halorubrum coriense DSM 10284]
MNEQDKVASFVQEHEMESPPTYRLLDVVSELGEVAKDAAESTDYGSSPEEVNIASDEIGDVLFSLLALAEATEIDAGEALEEAMAKYDERIADSGTPSSGN